MNIPDKAAEAAARAYASGYDSYPRPAQRDIEEVVIAIVEAAAPFIAAQALRDAASMLTRYGAAAREGMKDNAARGYDESSARVMDRADELDPQ